MKVLLTGISGFTGSFLARALCAAGHEVTGTYRRQTKFLNSLEALVGLTIVCVDLSQGCEIAGPFEAVVHAAATSPAAGISAAAIVRDNLDAMLALIDAANQWQTRSFILFSSLSVFGDIPGRVVDEQTPSINPDVYGTTKRLCETLLSEQAELSGLALRLPGIVGPGAHRNWLSDVAGKLISGVPVRAFNLDAPFNNAVHVADLCAMIVRLLERPWHGHHAVTLGARGEITIRGAIERLANALKTTANLQEVAAPRTAFTIASEQAIARWGYDPMTIEAMLDRFGAELVSHHSSRP